jgi:hypothetical protein
MGDTIQQLKLYIVRIEALFYRILLFINYKDFPNHLPLAVSNKFHILKKNHDF